MADINLKDEPVSTQPKSTVPMAVGGNKNALNRPVGPDGKRDWSYGLLDCFSTTASCRLCCFAGWCPWVVHTQNRRRLDSLPHQGVAVPSESDENCCKLALTADHSMLSVQIRHRREIREHYGIRGSRLGDWCTFFWCQSCALTQQRREIELEERNLPSE